MPIFHVDLFASHFFVPDHFSKMPVFFLEAVCFPFFRSHSFCKDAIFCLIFLLPIFCSQSIFVRCQFFTWSCLLPIFSSQSGLLRCQFFSFFVFCFPFFGPSPFFYDASFSLGVVCFRLGRSESFFQKSVFYLEPFFSPLKVPTRRVSSTPRLLPNLRLATCACHALLPRRAFLQTSSEPAPATTSSIPINDVSIQDLALPHAPATFPSGMFPSEPSPCHVRLPAFPRRGFLDIPSGRVGPPKSK